jgi:hypothetical protein
MLSTRELSGKVKGDFENACPYYADLDSMSPTISFACRLIHRTGHSLSRVHIRRVVVMSRVRIDRAAVID